MSFDEVSAGAVVFYRRDALEYLMLHTGYFLTDIQRPLNEYL
jgi:hypothetical protein